MTVRLKGGGSVVISPPTGDGETDIVLPEGSLTYAIGSLDINWSDLIQGGISLDEQDGISISNFSLGADGISNESSALESVVGSVDQQSGTVDNTAPDNVIMSLSQISEGIDTKSDGAQLIHLWVWMEDVDSVGSPAWPNSANTLKKTDAVTADTPSNGSTYNLTISGGAPTFSGFTWLNVLTHIGWSYRTNDTGLLAILGVIYRGSIKVSGGTTRQVFSDGDGLLVAPSGENRMAASGAHGLMRCVTDEPSVMSDIFNKGSTSADLQTFINSTSHIFLHQQLGVLGNTNGVFKLDGAFMSCWAYLGENSPSITHVRTHSAGQWGGDNINADTTRAAMSYIAAPGYGVFNTPLSTDKWTALFRFSSSVTNGVDDRSCFVWNIADGGAVGSVHEFGAVRILFNTTTTTGSPAPGFVRLQHYNGSVWSNVTSTSVTLAQAPAVSAFGNFFRVDWNTGRCSVRWFRGPADTVVLFSDVLVPTPNGLHKRWGLECGTTTDVAWFDDISFIE